MKNFVASLSLLIGIIQIHAGFPYCKHPDCTSIFNANDITYMNCTRYGSVIPYCLSSNNDVLSCQCNGYTPSPTIMNSNDHKYVSTPLIYNRGPIKTLIVKLFFGNENIGADMDLYNVNSLDSDVEINVREFFKDNSQNRLDYEFTLLTDNYQTSYNSNTVSNAQIIAEASRIAELDGFVYCNGICGYGNIDGNNLGINHDHYDQIIVLVDVNSGVNNYVSLGKNEMILKSDVIRDLSFGIQLGKTLGMDVSYSSKKDRIKLSNNSIGLIVDDITLMGYSQWNISNSRYKNNGHLSACAKEYLGFIDDSNIIDITSNSMNGVRIDAFDRPDMDLTNKKVALKYEWGSQNKYYENEYLNRYYVYYRTNINGPLSGITIEYCQLIRDSTLDTGGIIKTYILDVNGNTNSNTDNEFTNIGGTFTINPFSQSLIDETLMYEVVNPGILDVYPQITLNSLPNWDNCDSTTFECSSTDDLYVSVDVALKSASELGSISIDKTISCEYNTMMEEKQVLNETTESQVFIYKINDANGVGGRGISEFNMCPINTHIQAYVYDFRPDNFDPSQINKGIGSTMVCYLCIF